MKLFTLILFFIANLKKNNKFYNNTQIKLININNHNYTNLLGLTFLMLPFIYRNGEDCYDDNDCPHFMRCCQIGLLKYCCTPNNYIKLELTYLKK